MPPLPRSFAGRLALIVAGGLALRVAYALTLATHTKVIGDALGYHVLANLLADGHGFIRPYEWLLQGKSIPTAEHPPLYPLALAAVSKLGGTSFAAHRLVSCVIGAAAAGAAGVAGRLAAGERVGLATAAIAALHPLWWVNDGAIMSESLYLLCVALALAAALWVLRGPRPGRAVAAGLAIGAAALTRSEGAVLLVVLLVPACLLAGRGRRSAAGLVAVAALAFAIVLAPWEARGVARFDRLIPITTTSGPLLAGSNCDGTYHGPTIGLWRLDCVLAAERRVDARLGPARDEAERGARLAPEGRAYARDHLGRVPAVVAVRVLRTWDLWSPRAQAHYETFEGRHLRVEEAGVAVYYVLAVLALIGAWRLWRRDRRVLALLLAPCLLVTVVAASGYGVTRLRAGAEPSLAVLAATAMMGWRRDE